jgi:hypothetical protein
MSQNTQADATRIATKQCRKYLVDRRMALWHIVPMKRTTIWLTDSQVKALAKISKKTGMKQAELIRRFIDRGIEKSH